jgi:hypothetical protein
LLDAYLVPKPLPLQLLPFGRSGDGLEELTRGVGLFLPLSVRRGQFACAWRIVREVPVQPSSSHVRRVLARLHFRSGFALGFCCSQFADGPNFCRGRSGFGADGPPGPCGQSVFPGSSLVVLLAFTDCPRFLAGPFVWPLLTVCGTWPDCLRGQCGQSAPPGRTVRQCLAALFLGSIPPSFLSCFRVCFKESFLRLEVDL